MAARPPAYLDVGPLLAAAATALDTNDLLHGPVFSLHDVMTAVEVGDAKLDAGASATSAANGAPPPPPTPTPRLPADTALAVADGLLAAEAAWHAGGSAGTTLLPCTYLLRPDSALPCLFLHAMCASVRATCEAVRDLIVRGGVSEDEDFQLHPQAMPLPSVEEDADSLVASALKASSCADLGLDEPAAAGDEPPAGVLSLLRAHLRLRASFLGGVRSALSHDYRAAAAAFRDAGEALAALRTPRTSSPPPHSPPWPPPSFDAAAARAEVPPVPPRPDRAFDSVDEGLAHYATTLEHLVAAASLPAAVAARGGGLRASLRALADVAALNAGAAPRSVASLAMGLGVEPLEAPLPGLDGGPAAPGADGDGLPPAPPPRPPPGPWALCEGAVCGSLALPPPRSLPTPALSTFVAQAALGLQGWGVACLLNPARRRRRCRRALEDWVHVHQHAAVAEADADSAAWLAANSGWAWPWPEEPGGPPPPPPPPDSRGGGAGGHASPLSAWVEEAGARCGAAHLLSGFGLGLYAPHEHVAVLWYADYLARREASAAGALAARWPAKKGRPGGRRADPLGPPATKADPVAAAAAAADAAAAETKATLCAAALRAAAGLAAAGRTPPAPAPFNTPADAFRARFGCLGALTAPAPLSFADYRAAVLDQLADAAACPGRPADLVRGGREGYAWARSLLGGGPGGRGAGPGGAAAPAAACGLEAREAAVLARVAGANAVALGVLEKEVAAGGPGAFSIEYEDAGHPHFLVMRLKRQGG